MSEPLEVARYIFMNDESELRSGWRILAFVFFAILIALLLTSLIKALATLFPSLSFLLAETTSSESLNRRELIRLFVDSLRNLFAAVIATAISARLLERRSFASVGFKLHRGWSRDFLRGSLIGSASLTIAVGIATVAGAFSFDVQTRNGAHLVRGLTVTLVFFLISGATEELIFRGFPFQALSHNLGAPAALTISSAFFGIAHLSNDNASAFSTINTILAGIWLGIAYLITRSLWLATALHYSWNFVMVFLFGLPVSGFTSLDDLAWLRGSIGSPLWISGGSYGPEGGAAATAALILSTLVIWKSGLFCATEEMQAAIKHGKREPEVIRVTPLEHEQSSTPSDSHGSPR